MAKRNKKTSEDASNKQHPALNERKRFEPKFTSEPTGKFVVCPGSWGQGPIHFTPIHISEKGAMFAFCGHCNCRTFLNGRHWYDGGLEESDVKEIQDSWNTIKSIIEPDEDDGSGQR